MVKENRLKVQHEIISIFQSFHRGVLHKLPPKKGNLNEWIDVLADENIRQNNKYVQAADGKKSYEPKPAQKKHYQNLKWKAEQWGKIGVIPYLEQFAYHLSMPTEGLEKPILSPLLQDQGYSNNIEKSTHIVRFEPFQFKHFQLKRFFFKAISA